MCNVQSVISYLYSLTGKTPEYESGDVSLCVGSSPSRGTMKNKK